MPAETFDELIKNMPAIAKAVNAFSSEAVQQEAFRSLVRSFTDGELDGRDDEEQSDDQEPTKDTPAKRPAKRVAKKRAPAKKQGNGSAKPKRRAGQSIVKDLNLRPSNKKSFKDFAAEKAPKPGPEQHVVALYYLTQTLGLSPVGSDHVFTCFREAGWKLPADLNNRLQTTASRKGWIDTADMDDLQLMPAGLNAVEHDLPAKTKK